MFYCSNRLINARILVSTSCISNDWSTNWQFFLPLVWNRIEAVILYITVIVHVFQPEALDQNLCGSGAVRLWGALQPPSSRRGDKQVIPCSSVSVNSIQHIVCYDFLRVPRDTLVQVGTTPSSSQPTETIFLQFVATVLRCRSGNTGRDGMCIPASCHRLVIIPAVLCRPVKIRISRSTKWAHQMPIGPVCCVLSSHSQDWPRVYLESDYTQSLWTNITNAFQVHIRTHEDCIVRDDV